MRAKCMICNKEFYIRPSRYKIGWGRYCSPKCFHSSRIGIKFSIERRNNISKGKTGVKFTKEHKENISKAKKGYPAWNKGLKNIYSEETKKRMSQSRTGKHYSPKTEFKKGHKPANFKGRSTHSLGYIWIYSPSHPFCDNSKNVLEHRLQVEKQIRRFLNQKEMVHHINGIKNDNRPENLMAFTDRKSHIRFENGYHVEPKFIIFDGRKK